MRTTSQFPSLVADFVNPPYARAGKGLHENGGESGKVGSGQAKAVDSDTRTPVTSTNAAETVIMPGEDSVAALFAATSYLPGLIPTFWTLGGSVKPMAFSLYATVSW